MNDTTHHDCGSASVVDERAEMLRRAASLARTLGGIFESAARGRTELGSLPSTVDATTKRLLETALLASASGKGHR